MPEININEKSRVSVPLRTGETFSGKRSWSMKVSLDLIGNMLRRQGQAGVHMPTGCAIAARIFTEREEQGRQKSPYQQPAIPSGACIASKPFFHAPFPTSCKMSRDFQRLSHLLFSIWQWVCTRLMMIAIAIQSMYQRRKFASYRQRVCLHPLRPWRRGNFSPHLSPPLGILRGGCNPLADQQPC